MVSLYLFLSKLQGRESFYVLLMATHSSTLAWKIPWTEEPGRLQSMGSLRATSLSLFTFMHWRGKWLPTPVFLPGESQGQGAWWAAVYGVAQSRTRLKRLSSSSSSSKLNRWQGFTYSINYSKSYFAIFIYMYQIITFYPLLLLLNHFSHVWLCATA